MSMTFEAIQPAGKQDISVYMPYYQGSKRNALPYAISLYNSIAFVATWNVSVLPADLTRCRMQFDGDSDLSYEITMATFEFVDFLFDVIVALRQKRPADFSQGFYRKLLRLDD